MRTFGFRTSVTTLVMLLGTIGTSAQAANSVPDDFSSRSERASIDSDVTLSNTASSVSIAAWLKTDNFSRFLASAIDWNAAVTVASSITHKTSRGYQTDVEGEKL